MENYRLKYKRYYGIDFGKDYVIHHIDFDRNNNDISNLLLLPKELHTQYHIILNILGGNNGLVDLRLNRTIKTFANLPQCISECQKWQLWKKYEYDDYIRHFIFDTKEKTGGK